MWSEGQLTAYSSGIIIFDLNPEEMKNLLDKGEIILYQSDDESTQLEVLIDEETVWLSQVQMVELFSSTKQNISLQQYHAGE